jgi:hypothetical protein
VRFLIYSGAGRAECRPRVIKTAIEFVVAAALVLTGAVPATAANQIVLSGTVASNCTMNVTADPGATNLVLDAGAKRVAIGTILQNCNKKAGYTVVVTSTNCATPAPTGAKLVGISNGDKLSYSVEATNPTTGGSAPTVTGLLASSCTAQKVRVVTESKVSGETSSVFINYTGSSSLSDDTYQDTLTFTLNLN